MLKCLSRGKGGGALDEFVEQESEQDRVLKTLSSWWARPTTTADIAVGASSHAASINADSAAREDSLCVSGKAVAAFLKRKHGGDDAHRVHVVESGSKKKKQTLFRFAAPGASVGPLEEKKHRHNSRSSFC